MVKPIWTLTEALCAEIAKQAHKDSKLYGGLPYFTHCEAVARLAKDKGCNQNIVGACFLHDVLEDTTLEAKDLLTLGVPPEIIKLVEAVTDPPGKNRKERKAVAYKNIKAAGQEAIIVKLCDRIINTMMSRIHNPTGLLEMYQREYREFSCNLGYSPPPTGFGEDCRIGWIVYDLWQVVSAVTTNE